MAKFSWSFEKYEEVTNKLDSIENKVDKLTNMVKDLSGMMTNVPTNNPVSTGKSKATKTTKATKGKGKGKSNDFDRSLYEATAKKLGVWNDEFGKVTGTYKDGKKVVDAKHNRQMVYEAMGIK